jgi:hypothetical protein
MSKQEEFWREALSDLPASSLSLRRFCQERRLDYYRALYWRRRLGELDNAPLSFAVLQLPKPAAEPEPAAPPSDSGVAVECGGRLVRLNRHFDESVLLRVMAVLSGRREA